MWSLAWPLALLALPLPLILRHFLPEAKGLSEAGLRVPNVDSFSTLKARPKTTSACSPNRRYKTHFHGSQHRVDINIAEVTLRIAVRQLQKTLSAFGVKVRHRQATIQPRQPGFPRQSGNLVSRRIRQHAAPQQFGKLLAEQHRIAVREVVSFNPCQ